MGDHRIPELVVAALIQYAGTSTRRRYVMALKMLAVVAPGARVGLKESLGGVEPNTASLAERLGRCGTLLLQGQVIKAADDLRQLLIEVAIDVLLWVLTLYATVWALFGHVVEAVLAGVAEVIRRPGQFPTRSYLLTLSDQWKNIRGEIQAAFDATEVWTMMAAADFEKEQCASVPTANEVSAFSFCAQSRPYQDSGRRVRYQLRDGRLEMLVDGRNGSQWQRLAGLSFHRSRAGEPLDGNVRFDMIAASNDRVFVKEALQPRYYFALPEEIFAGTGDGVDMPDVPSLYFKLDPEPDSPPLGRVRQIAEADAPDKVMTHPQHPQAERLPLLHTLVGHGLLPAMVVSVKPKTLYRIDTRAPRLGIPSRVPQALRDLPTRHCNGFKGHERRLVPGITIPAPDDNFKEEFAYDLVLGLGVGNFHFYEPWQDDHGGEIQWLRSRGWFGLATNEALYGLFNGPIADGEGAIDGTCNFYILVRLKPGAGQRRYGILWCDEQTFFTKRWRLMHPADNEPSSLDLPNDVNLSVHALVENDRRTSLISGQYEFSPRRFESSDPFHNHWVDDNSRLAVARQVVLVTGRRDGVPALFSINYSYGSLDRIWRWRALPRRDGPMAGGGSLDFDPMIEPATIELREDMTITIRGRGRGRPQGPVVTGRWVQRYLPFDRRHPQSVDGAAEFTHPWRFHPQGVYDQLSAYSHFGVVDRVDSRTQYYEVDLLQSLVPPSELDGALVKDLQDQLCIRARKFRWGAFNDPQEVSDYLRGPLPQAIKSDREIDSVGQEMFFSWNKRVKTEDLEYRASRTSMFNPQAAFRLLNRGPNGWIAVWHDKRDDDLVPLSDLPAEVWLDLPGADLPSPGLVAAPSATTLRPPRIPRRVQLRLRRCHRVTRAPSVERIEFRLLDSGPGTGGFLTISMVMRQSWAQALKNLWRLRVCAWSDPKANPITLVDLSDLMTHMTVRESLGLDGLRCSTSGMLTLNAEHASLLRADRAHLAGTTAWFEDIVGHVSTADETIFAD